MIASLRPDLADALYILIAFSAIFEIRFVKTLVLRQISERFGQIPSQLSPISGAVGSEKGACTPTPPGLMQICGKFEEKRRFYGKFPKCLTQLHRNSRQYQAAGAADKKILGEKRHFAGAVAPS